MSRLVLLSFFGLLGCSTGVEDLASATPPRQQTRACSTTACS
jgi:hypothetical protein